jgi:hypothetical protein
MSIKDISKKIKPYWEIWLLPRISLIRENLNPREDIFIVLVIILVGLAGFGLGKISALEKSRGIVDIQPVNWPLASSTRPTSLPTSVVVPQSAAAMVASEKAVGFLVASKGGKKYHFPWCAGAAQIAEKNKIWFDSYEEAQRAGYSAATNCQGLK